MHIEQICENNFASTAWAILFAIIILGIFGFVIARNISKLIDEIIDRRAEKKVELEIRHLRQAYEDEHFTDNIETTKSKRGEKKPVNGCKQFAGQLLLALIGLAAAAIGATSPFIQIPITAICGNIVNNNEASEDPASEPTLTPVNSATPMTALPSSTPIPTLTLTLIPSPAPTSTLSPTMHPSSTSFPSPTQTLIPTPAPTSTPPATAFQRYHLLPLDSGRYWPNGYNLGLQLPTSTVAEQFLRQIPFEVGRQYDTLGCTQGTSDIFSVPANIQDPHTVYFLIQAGNGYITYAGEELGRLTLEFDAGEAASMPLIMGVNIRDWALSSNAVNTVTSPETIEALQGRQQETNREGRMDIITFEIPSRFDDRLLRSVRIEDTNIGEPCIHLQAITVEASLP